MVEEGTFEHSAHQWWPFPLPSPLLPPRRRSSFVPPMMSAVRGKHGKGRWVWSPRGSSPLSVPTTNIFLSWAPPTDRRHLFLLSPSPSPSSNTRGALLPLGWVGPGGWLGRAAFWSLSEEQTTASGLPPLFFYFRPPFSLGIFFFFPSPFRRHFLPLHLAAPNEEPKRRNGRKWASEEFQSHSTFLRHLVPFFGCLFAKDASPPPLPAHSGKKRASLLIPRLWAEMGSPRNEKGPSRSEGKESRRRERDRSH